MTRAWLALSCLAVSLSTFCLSMVDGATPSRPGPLVGKAAPPFQIQGIAGESYTLEAFKGHILVMQFGTSW